ncbi:MAG: hypothetical protein ACFE0J_21540 [Elainellaceae cyanobacterium]
MAGILLDSYVRGRTILKTLNATNSPLIETLWEPGWLTPYDRSTVLRYSGIIRSLRAKIKIESLPESTLPNMDVTTSRTDRLSALRELEWNSPRKQFDVWLRNAYVQWTHIFSVSALNRPPFYQVDLLPFFCGDFEYYLAEDSAIGISITDVGYGLLHSGDEITIFGSVREEANALPGDGQPTVSTNFGASVTTQSQVILPANSQRKMAIFVNTSPTHDIYLSYGAVAVTGQGIPILRNGGTHEINHSNLWQGVISAVATGNATVSGMEAV